MHRRTLSAAGIEVNVVHPATAGRKCTIAASAF